MPPSKVYWIEVEDGESLASLSDKSLTLAEACLRDVVVAARPCAIKQHFGERDNTGYVKPEITKTVVAFVEKMGGQPFVTDTNTLYRGRRSQAVDHLHMAREHGFTFEALGAPVIIADGLLGADQVAVPIAGGKRFKEVRIASAGHHAASAIVLTHVKGHCEMGLGGAIKNVGMGFAARAGKLAQHHAGAPEFTAAKCTACGTCVRWCPTDAIELKPKARLIRGRCIGCGECYALCPFGAIGFQWSEEGPVLIEKVCEHVLGFLAHKVGHCGYINYVIDLTRNCDCVGKRQKTEYGNVGIFAGTDIVAVDKACADAARDRFGVDIFTKWWPKSGYTAQFEYGERIGIGSQKYKLVRA